MAIDLKASLGGNAPPDGVSNPVAALWWLAKGDLQLGAAWETAHELCQSQEGDKAHDWVHALAHMIEDDQWNADYWYRRAGEDRKSDDLQAEWDHILAALG